MTISTFAQEGMKVNRRINGKLTEVKMERDMVGRLLMLSLTSKIDMKLVFEYPLSPVPLVFGHIDGSINHTPKSTLIKALVGSRTWEPPKIIDSYIVDGFFFLHLHATRLPAVNDEVVAFLLTKLVNFNAKEIHFVLDNIPAYSIKDIERERRGNSDRYVNYSTLGLKQKRPTNFLLALRSDTFKQEFAKLLLIGFSDPILSPILGDKVLFLTVGEKCFSFRKSETGITRTEEIQMKCFHEEADTRVGQLHIIFPVINLALNLFFILFLLILV